MWLLHLRRLITTCQRQGQGAPRGGGVLLSGAGPCRHVAGVCSRPSGQLGLGVCEGTSPWECCAPRLINCDSAALMPNELPATMRRGRGLCVHAGEKTHVIITKARAIKLCFWRFSSTMIIILDLLSVVWLSEQHCFEFHFDLAKYWLYFVVPCSRHHSSEVS